MDVPTLAMALGLIKNMPDQAASYAEAAEAAQAAAEEAAETVMSATVAEALDYLGIEEA